MSMLKAAKVNLMVCDEFLAKIDSKIHGICSLTNFFLEYMIKTGFRFTLDFNLFLKFFH
jgi:hypothetical protein